MFENSRPRRRVCSRPARAQDSCASLESKMIISECSFLNVHSEIIISIGMYNREPYFSAGMYNRESHFSAIAKVVGYVTYSYLFAQ